MENKKTYKFGIGDNSFFIEKRLVFKGPPLKSPPPEETDPSGEEPSEEKKTAPEKEAAEAEQRREKEGIELKTDVSKAVTKAKGQAEREKVKPVQLPTTSPLKMEDFKQKVDSREHKKELDLLKINILREGYQSNAQKWNHFSEEGLKEIYSDCREAGIPVNDPFYKSMFAILNMGIDQNKNTHLADPDYQIYFQDPANHMKDLLGLSVCTTGFDPVAFAKAYEHLQYIQGILLSQDAYQAKTLAAQEGLDKDPVAGKVTDFLRSNLSQFQKAIKERDYATAGLYCVGIWAIYRSMKELGVFGKEGKSTKWLAYGLATYCGYVFAKNAGYDVLKIAGFRDQDYEVKGTPLEAIDNILRSQPHLRELAKDLDYGITLRMSEVSLVDLHELFKESNKQGIQFIHPYQFPEIFPDLAKQWPFEMGIGEKGLKDYTGMANTKLSTGQREYIRVGKQLYKLALAMQGVYEATLYVEHPEYKGLPYEKMLVDPTKKLGKIRHLLGAAYDYAPAKPERGLTSTKSIDEAQEHLDKAFEGLEVGLTLERQIGKSGHFEAKLMEYPVVFVRTGNVYRVYLKPSYKGAEKPGTDYIAEIPIEEGSRQILEVDKAVKGVRNRMLDLLRPLQGTGGRSLTDTSLKYEYGEWTCEVTLPGSAAFDIASTPTKATIIPHSEGKRIDVVATNGVRIVVDELVAKQYPIGLSLVPRLTAQEEFKALQIFSNAGLIRIDKVDSTNKTFLVYLSNTIKPFELKYDSTTKKFDFIDRDPTTKVSQTEQKLIQDPAFANAYIDSLEKDELFAINKTIEALAKSMDSSTPEGFVGYFFQSLFQDTLKGPLNGFNLDALSGTVPQGFSKMVLESSKYETYQRIRRGISKSKSLNDVLGVQNDILTVYGSKLRAIKTTLDTKNFDLKSADGKWDRDEYRMQIIDAIRLSGCSKEYARFKSEMEYIAYRFAPGILKSSDFSDTSHRIVGSILGVFSYYTAHLDGEKYVYENPPGTKNTEIINFASLIYPPSKARKFPSGTFAKDYLDPGLRGHYILRYMEYVKRAIADKSGQIDNKSLVPSGDVRSFWGIADFEQWLESPEATYQAIDVEDNKDPFEHDVALHKEKKHTQFDEYMISEYRNAVGFLMTEYGDILNDEALELFLSLNYLNSDETDYIRDPNTGMIDVDHIGLFTIYPKINLDSAGTETPVTDASGKQIWLCKLWEVSDEINNTTKGSKYSRGQQIQLVQERVNDFIAWTLSARNDDGTLRFFKSPPSLGDRIRVQFPRAYAKIEGLFN